MVSANELMLVSKDTSISLLKSPVPIRFLQGDSQFLYLGTSHSITVLNFHGDIIKTILVHNDRQLAAAFLQPEQHLYLFRDRFAQILEKGQTHFFQLPFGKAKKIYQLACKDSLVAVNIDGVPFTYQIASSPSLASAIEQ
jgi:hypothetical protein